jgi:hypothetical protein
MPTPHYLIVGRFHGIINYITRKDINNMSWESALIKPAMSTFAKDVAENGEKEIDADFVEAGAKQGARDITNEATETAENGASKGGSNLGKMVKRGAGAGAVAGGVAKGAGRLAGGVGGGVARGAMNLAKNIMVAPQDQSAINSLVAPVQAGTNIGVEGAKNAITSINGANNNSDSIANAKEKQSSIDTAEANEQATARHH